MKKIKENVDYSRQVLEIDIKSPIFNSMLNDMNGEIMRVVDQVYDGKFENGEISLKLKFTIEEGLKEFPKTDDFGNVTSELYQYKKPKFEHNITTTLKKNYKREGLFTGERELQLVDGEYIAVPVKSPQMHLGDIGYGN